MDQQKPVKGPGAHTHQEELTARQVAGDEAVNEGFSSRLGEAVSVIDSV